MKVFHDIQFPEKGMRVLFRSLRMEREKEKSTSKNIDKIRCNISRFILLINDFWIKTHLAAEQDNNNIFIEDLNIKNVLAQKLEFATKNGKLNFFFFSEYFQYFYKIFEGEWKEKLPIFWQVLTLETFFLSIH